MLPELKIILQPPIYRWMEETWKHLTKSDVLFSTLQKAVQHKSLGEAMQLAEAWGEFVDDEENEQIKRRLEHQWGIVRLLVQCADFASQGIVTRNELNTAIAAALADRPNLIQSDEEVDRALIYIQALRHFPKSRIVIPIAGWDKEEAAKAAKDANDEEAEKKLGDSGGFIARFVLETFENGKGQLTHHPIDLFFALARTTQGQKDFVTSLGIAWKVANDLSQQKDSFYGCWRLLTEDGMPMIYASGASASGAAAWGWYCALTEKVYDPRVIVLAQINAKGVLEGVLGVPAKVKAIAAQDGFDTIVVASQENEKEAVKKLQEIGKLGTIRVVNLSEEKSLPQQL